MKKTIAICTAIIIALQFPSCVKDSEINLTTQQYEGRFFVEIQDNHNNGEWTSWDYRVVFEEAGTDRFFNVRFHKDDLQNYISKSGLLVCMDAELSQEMLQPVEIQVLEMDQMPLKGKGGKGGGGSSGKSMLVVMISDSVSTPNCSVPDIEDQLIGSNNPESTASLYTESSRGKFTLGSVTFEDVYIPQIRCQLGYIRGDVNPVLTAQGVVLNDYDYIMYVTAPLCSYGGTAYLNGNSFHNAYCTWPVVSAHELGHCLGMHHSGAWNDDGSMSYYGDPSCVMGVVHREINALHRIGVGWLANKNIKSVKNPGTYALVPLEIDNTNGKQVLTVDVGMVHFNHPEQYYLSYRAPIGPLDDELSAEVVNKLSIHTWRGALGEITRYVGALDSGQTYTDLENGVEITNLGIINEVMTVQIDFGTGI